MAIGHAELEVVDLAIEVFGLENPLVESLALDVVPLAGKIVVGHLSVIRRPFGEPGQIGHVIEKTEHRAKQQMKLEPDEPNFSITDEKNLHGGRGKKEVMERLPRAAFFVGPGCNITLWSRPRIRKAAFQGFPWS